MKKLVITLLTCGMVSGAQANGGDAALGAVGGLAVGTMIGRSSRPRKETVIVEREPRQYGGYDRYDRIADLERTVKDLRYRLDEQGRKLDSILSELRAQPK